MLIIITSIHHSFFLDASALASASAFALAIFLLVSTMKSQMSVTPRIRVTAGSLNNHTGSRNNIDKSIPTCFFTNGYKVLITQSRNLLCYIASMHYNKQQ